MVKLGQVVNKVNVTSNGRCQRPIESDMVQTMNDKDIPTRKMDVMDTGGMAPVRAQYSP